MEQPIDWVVVYSQFTNEQLKAQLRDEKRMVERPLDEGWRQSHQASVNRLTAELARRKVDHEL